MMTDVYQPQSAAAPDVCSARSLRQPHFFDRECIVARPGYNRWLVPPAALAIHLCIGMAYGFSVFLQPLARVVGVEISMACPDQVSLGRVLVTTGCDWRVSDLGWVYTLFFIFLGTAAAVWGGWVERVGPRTAGIAAALCWSGGHLIAALGVASHQLWLVWLGFGAVGGIGLGIGYILPVSTLMTWFPDRRGLAGGLAVMGFGGGAMIGAPLANMTMDAFKTPASVGVWQTFLVLGAIYLVAMSAGALGFRLPHPGWQPDARPGLPPSTAVAGTDSVHYAAAPRTVQFWLLWAILCLNVSAGIGILGVASLMLQEIFGGQLLGMPGLALVDLGSAQRTSIAVIAAGFTGLLSLFNIAGRLFWAWLSDRIGRKTVFYCFSTLGVALYAGAPSIAHVHAIPVFVGMLCLLVSMFGGAFATMPAYVADTFGPRFVGAIQGRILTAWSVAGIVGPVLVDTMRERELARGVPPAAAYDLTLHILSGLLALALLANAAIRPLGPNWFTRDQGSMPSQENSMIGSIPLTKVTRSGVEARVALAWLCIGLPMAWGAWMTVTGTLALFRFHASGS